MMTSLLFPCVLDNRLLFLSDEHSVILGGFETGYSIKAVYTHGVREAPEHYRVPRIC